MKVLKSGVYPAMVTPYTESGDIDRAAVAQLVDWYAEKGVDGIFAACQSSEIFFLTLRERVELVKDILARTPAEIDVVVSGHTADSVRKQIDELKAMADTGAKAVVLITNRLAGPHDSDDVLLKNTDRILNAMPGVSFGLYECPYPYKRLLSADVLRRLAKTGRFSFVKETSCDLGVIAEKVKAVAGTGVKLFNANSATFLDSLELGVDGICGVMANFHPDLYCEMIRCRREDPEKARWLQRYLGVTSLVEYQCYPTNAKYYLQLEGLPMKAYSRRSPSDQISPAMQTVLQQFYELNQDIRRQLETGVNFQQQFHPVLQMLVPSK